MFIAHLPAGYIAARAALRDRNRAAFIAMLIGSVVPDIDILAFYFWDDRAFHHHEYLTHRPVLWLLITAIGAMLLSRTWGGIMMWLGVGGLVHMLCDTFLGTINWGWPLADFGGPLVVVPATRSHWILSFLTHWTFLVELAICAGALILWRRSRR